MRKVKAAAAFLCLATAGLFGGVTIEGQDLSVASTDQTDQILEVTAEHMTALSAETTTAVTTTKAQTETTTVTYTETAVTTETSETTTETETAVTTTETAYETEPVTYADEPAETEAVEITEIIVTEQTAAVTEENAAYPVTDAQPESEPEPVPEEIAPALTVTDQEYIILCNIVGHEYGSAWVPVEEKALVVEVIMNRVNSPLFPNTIYDVLTQKNQFSGLGYLIEMDTMSKYVTDSVRAAVDLYLADPSQFQHGYLYFSGDGYRNYFRT